jgi:hypothetical protein
MSESHEPEESFSYLYTNTNEEFADSLTHRFENAIDYIKSKNRGRITQKAKTDLDEIRHNSSINSHRLLLKNKLPRWSLDDEYTQIDLLMQLYANNPSIAETITSRGIVGIHGSSSGSLLGVLDHGLRPQDFLDERNIVIATGEGVYGSADLNKTHVSFFPWFKRHPIKDYLPRTYPLTVDMLLEVTDYLKKQASEAEGREKHFLKTIRNLENTIKFISKDPKNEEEKLGQELTKENYPILYFIDQNHFKENQIRKTGLDDEFAIRDGIPPQGIPMIVVPEEFREKTRKIIENKGKNIAVFRQEDYFFELPSSPITQRQGLKDNPIKNLSIKIKTRFLKRN